MFFFFFFFLIQFFYLIKDMSLRKKFLSKLFLYLLIGCEFRKSNHWIVCSYYKLHAIVKFQENQILINSSTFDEILHINITFYRFEITIHYKQHGLWVMTAFYPVKFYICRYGHLLRRYSLIFLKWLLLSPTRSELLRVFF